MKASHKQFKSVIGFNEVNLEKGQFIFGILKATEETGLSYQSVRTCLQTLKSTNNITIKSTNKYSIISIVNWEHYQSEENEINNQINSQDNKQLTNKQQTTNNIQTHKNEKNVKNKDLVARRRQIPSDFILSEKLIQFAKEHGINGNRIKDVFDHFKEHHQSRGTVMLDWDKAFMTWVRNDKKFNPKKQNDFDGPLQRVLRAPDA